MGFTKKTLALRNTEHLVWQRDPLEGNLVIVVIDDECRYARADSDKVLILDQAIFPQLREHVCSWEETRSIGFFLLMDTVERADEVLDLIQKWLDKVTTPDTQVYFLVDALYGDGVGVATNHTVEQLTKSYPQNHIAYLTKAGRPGIIDLLEGYEIFQKGDEAKDAQGLYELSPKLRSFFGKGRHEDEIIDGAIRFYATPWEVGWAGEGWGHNYLQETNSDQLRALAEWLGISIDDLYESPDEGESAKSLMIWVGGNLWGDRRQIQGTVLNAALKKLDLPLIVSEEEVITMPCGPCFPFLVSLRSFLWHCAAENTPVPVGEICFFRQGENSQVNIIRLPLQLQDSDTFKRKFLGTERRGTFTNALVDLTHCRTAELTGGKGRG